MCDPTLYPKLRVLLLPTVLALLLGPPAVTAAGLSPGCGWGSGFFARDLDRPVDALAVFDDGNGRGPAVYAAGQFGRAGDVQTAKVAKWDGALWWPLVGSGGGMIEDPSRVFALTVWKGSLYIGGELSSADGTLVNHIVRWDGTDYHALAGSMGTGVDGPVRALMAFDDGGGGKLIVGGAFAMAGGLEANSVAAWDGEEWSAVGSGFDGDVLAFEPFDDGSGLALYAGGAFTEADGITVEHIAKWNGVAWSDLTGPQGTGLDAPVTALEVWDGRLIAAGEFLTAGGKFADKIASWDGTDFSALTEEEIEGSLSGLLAWDDGDGEDLYAVGEFDAIGATAARQFARFDGVGWTGITASVGPGFDRAARALVAFDDGDRSMLYIGGAFERISADAVGHIATFDGAFLDKMPSIALGMVGDVEDFVLWNGGLGPDQLYAAGRFSGAGTAPDTSRLARWDGARWKPVAGPGMGFGAHGDVRALAVFEGELYVAGAFSGLLGDIMANNIVSYSGLGDYEPLTGALGTGTDGLITSLATFDDGGGEALYLAGDFTTAGGIAASRIARWDGTDFTALGSGLDGTVQELIVWDDGGGGDLYVAGEFLNAGGVAVNHLARWDGTAFSAVTGALGTGTDAPVDALGEWAGDLYLGGRFSQAGGVTATRIARFDGADYSALTDGGSEGVRGDVRALHVFDDGSGDALYIGVVPTTESIGVDIGALGRYGGAAFEPLAIEPGAGSPDSISALTDFMPPMPGAAPALWAGGSIRMADGILTSNVGLYACDSIPPTAPTTFDCPSHEVGVPDVDDQIIIEWSGAGDVGAAGLYGYSYTFDQNPVSEPDHRCEQLHGPGTETTTSEPLDPGAGYYFHLRTCDRMRNCVTQHLGPFEILEDPMIFTDGFESGDVSAWSSFIT